MNAPWQSGVTLASEDFERVRRRAIFDCCKWDPQMEDHPSLADFALVLRPGVWRELASMAESLAAETLALEAELVERPDLLSRLALPRAVRSAVCESRVAPASGTARLIRFDFHHTTEGWRISEANSDVPGGLNEASGLGALMWPFHPDASTVGDVADAYARALIEGAGSPATIALVHATGYSDDHQVMAYLARRLESLGARALMVSPAHISWRQGRAHAQVAGTEFAIGAIVRFYPGEWLPNLPRASGWKHFFRGCDTPMSNPATALVTQSKRFPLLWGELHSSVREWRRLLPETRDPRDAPWRTDESWMVKPALGRVGEGIGMLGVTGSKEWARIERSARWRPSQWVAQRRFTPTPLTAGDATWFPCVGVYTVDTRAVGAYGRLARHPIIDWHAQDVAVLMEREMAEIAQLRVAR